MDALLDEHFGASRNGDLSTSLSELQKTMDLLDNARVAIASKPGSASLILAKLQTPVKTSFDAVNKGLKDVHHGITKYSKALDKKFKDRALPTIDYDALSMHSDLISRAIGMHFLREGQFSVASTFLNESVQDDSRSPAVLISPNQGEPRKMHAGKDPMRSKALREQFSEMYHILDEMKTSRNLEPATKWARSHRVELEQRGSNLEFDLCRLQFVWLFEQATLQNGLAGQTSRQMAALAYAKKHFAHFQSRHLKDIRKLIGAMAFCTNLTDSPYKRFFYNENSWGELAASFTREFCSRLGLSAESPVYIAATAGAIALPTLQKLQVIMETKRTEWTTQHELPVELPLPPTYRFHSIFVCPVSKEQTTDDNPPMMMPCGHVIARESLQRLGKVSKFKCPYCPGESRVSQAEKVYL